MAEGLFAVLERVVVALNDADVPYAVTGSVASSYHGEPYGSLDVDLVVAMTIDKASAVATALSGKFYADEQMLREAAAQRRMANVIDHRSGVKIHISVMKDEPYYHQIMQRRQQVTWPGIEQPLWFVSAEDVVLMKLEWRKESQSQKQWQNALSVIQTNGQGLDWAYMKDWADRLGVADALRDMMKEANV